MGRIISKEKFTSALDSRHSVMFAHIFDMAETSSRRGCSVYGDFLSENSLSVLYSRRSFLPAEPVLFGGTEDSERQMVAFIDEYDEADFPIGAVRVSSPMLKNLSHRDFLGSVLGLGIKREKCGDIIILSDVCYIILHRDIVSFVASELTKVGRVGVKCTECELSDIILPPKSFTPISGTVASLRLDAIVSHFAGKGRSQASELIGAGFVFVNGVLCEKNDVHLKDGDTLSVRGHGKATLEVGGKSKKDRIFITLHKYS